MVFFRPFAAIAGLGHISEIGGGLNRSTQHFILKRKDGV